MAELDIDTFLAGLDSPNHSPESRLAWVMLFHRDMTASAKAEAQQKTCDALAAWADAAEAESPRVGKGARAIWKSDLLSRLVYGGEKGPSRTPCPVHQGKWSGCHAGWPGSQWRHVDGTATPMEVEPMLQGWYDAGCRCFQHKGSSCTTGWNPDEHCCA